jgi:hypothetical protein
LNAAREICPRYPRWVVASHRLARYETFMVPTLQGLGRLDEQLANRDDCYVTGQGYIREGFGLLDFSDHITLSYLWVLGAYEVVRVIAERERNGQTGFAVGIAGLLRQFERVRIPLAKFEPAKKHRDTDSHIAYPALNETYGVAWQVAEDTYISRGELSEGLLSVLESAAP